MYAIRSYYDLHEVSKVFRLGAAGEAAMKAHARMPDLAINAAQQLGKVLEAAIASKRIDEAALFDRHYEQIANTKPPKFSTRFDKLTDEIFPRIQESVLRNNFV